MSNAENSKIKNSDINNSSFKELSIIKKFIFWVDTISDGKTNNNAIFARPFNDKNAIPQQLTGDNFYIKSNFHGYGGKSYQCIEVNNQIYLVWIEFISKALWFRILKYQEVVPENDNGYFLCDSKPRQLTEKTESNFDASFIISRDNFWSVNEFNLRSFTILEIVFICSIEIVFPNFSMLEASYNLFL